MALPFLHIADWNSVSITLLGAGGGPANETQMVNLVNSVLYAHVISVQYTLREMLT